MSVLCQLTEWVWWVCYANLENGCDECAMPTETMGVMSVLCQLTEWVWWVCYANLENGCDECAMPLMVFFTKQPFLQHLKRHFDSGFLLVSLLLLCVFIFFIFFLVFMFFKIIIIIIILSVLKDILEVLFCLHQLYFYHKFLGCSLKEKKRLDADIRTGIITW